MILYTVLYCNMRYMRTRRTYYIVGTDSKLEVIPRGRFRKKAPELFWQEAKPPRAPSPPGVGMGATWWRCKVAPIAIKMEESRREARTRAVAPGAQANGAGAQPSLALATPPNSHGRWRWLRTSSCRTRCRSKVSVLAPHHVGGQRD